MVDVQAILFASLTASLLSAFLAMLGKQWLNRYASTDMRGSAIERSQNRQRKLDGIVKWYFDSVMESLPLMLQIALLLLGCALSRYLWESNTTIASVVIGVTSFGLLFYLFILIAGTIWESCPYQTPGSHFFRHLGPKVRRVVHFATTVFKSSKVVYIITWNAELYDPWWSGRNIAPFLKRLIDQIPLALAEDAYHLGRAVVRLSVAPLTTAYRLVRRMHSQLQGISPTPEQRLDHKSTVLDLRCISWTLETSLEKPVHRSTLNHLVTIAEFTDFDSNLVMHCFNIFFGCISISNRKVVVRQGLEQFAIVSARCLFKALRHLSAIRPTSSVLADLRRRYQQMVPHNTDFLGLPFYHAMTNIHAFAIRDWNPRFVLWYDYQPSHQELIPFSRHMVDVVQAEYQQTQSKRVSRWVLRFALNFLSEDPSSPTSVIADCLTIIAIALDYNPSSVPALDERYIFLVSCVPTVLTEVQCTSGASLKPHHSEA